MRSRLRILTIVGTAAALSALAASARATERCVALDVPGQTLAAVTCTGQTYSQTIGSYQTDSRTPMYVRLDGGVEAGVASFGPSESWLPSAQAAVVQESDHDSKTGDSMQSTVIGVHNYGDELWSSQVDNGVGVVFGVWLSQGQIHYATPFDGMSDDRWTTADVFVGAYNQPSGQEADLEVSGGQDNLNNAGCRHSVRAWTSSPQGQKEATQDLGACPAEVPGIPLLPAMS